MTDEEVALYFKLFTEIGIIDQLTSTKVAKHLPAGLLPAHFGVLNHLFRVGSGNTPAHIAEAFQVPRSTMTHTLAILARHGHVEFRPNPKDGRSKVVHLTEGGRVLREEVISRLVPDMAAFASAFPASGVRGAAALLEEMRIHLDRERNDD